MRVRIRHACNHPVLGWLGLLAAGAATAAEPASTQAWVTVPPDVSVHASLGPDLGFAEGRRTTPEGEQLRLIGTAEALDRLRAQGWDVHPIAHGTDDRDGYRLPDNTDLTAYLGPRSGIVSVGHSRQGRRIDALWYGQPPHLGAPAVRIAGAHHGDESSSFEVALDAAEWLADADGVDAEVTALLDTATVWVLPWVNPDGAQADTRQNAVGVDLNRNYGFEWSSQAFESGSAPFSEPETRAMRDLGLLTLPHTSLSLHSGATNIGYVWNYSYTATPEEGLLDDLGVLYADGTTVNGFYVTNGADWYPTRGDTNDWSYGAYGGMDFTVELTRNKTPVPSTIADFLADHRDGVHNVVLEVPALSGAVHTPDGTPLWAELVLLADGVVVSAPFFANADSGRFMRHATVADSIRITSPGYASATLPWEPGEPVDVVLQPSSLSDVVVSPTHAAPGDSVMLSQPIGPVVSLRAPGRSAVVSVSNSAIALPADLPPGRYSVSSSDGTTLRDALFVEAQATPTVDTVTQEGTTLTVRGAQLGRGPRAWAASDGRFHPLVPLSGTDTEGTFELPDDLVNAPQIRVEVAASGTYRGFLLTNTASPDTDTPADTGPIRFGRSDTGCGCSAGSTPAAWLLPLFLLLPLYRRRSL